MWDFTLSNAMNVLDNQQPCDQDLSIMRSAKSAHADGIVIRDRLTCVLKRKDRQLNTLDGADGELVAQMDAEIALLHQQLHKIDHYVETLSWFCEVEDLVDECKRQDIDPAFRITSKGCTLKMAVAEMQDFLAKPDPFQEFDRHYR